MIGGKVTPLENTQDDVKVHKSRKERYRESSYSVNVGLNVMEVFSLDIGVAGYNKNHKDTISVSNSATYLYEKESRQLAKAIPTLKPEMKELLLEGKKEEFRRRCGDQFARTVTKLYLRLEFQLKPKSVNLSYQLHLR